MADAPTESDVQEVVEADAAAEMQPAQASSAPSVTREQLAAATRVIEAEIARVLVRDPARSALRSTLSATPP